MVHGFRYDKNICNTDKMIRGRKDGDYCRRRVTTKNDETIQNVPLRKSSSCSSIAMLEESLQPEDVGMRKLRKKPSDVIIERFLHSVGSLRRGNVISKSLDQLENVILDPAQGPIEFRLYVMANSDSWK